jgi:predicted alpha/beta-fold hydrolase
MKSITYQRLRVPFWKRGKHLQTLLPAIHTGRIKPLSFEKKMLHSATAVYQSQAPTSVNKIAILLPGMESHFFAPYMLKTFNHLVDQGFKVFALEHRAFSFESSKVNLGYHAGLVDDIHALIDRLWHQYQLPMTAVGFSLGGTMLVNAIAKDPQVAKSLVACACVSMTYSLSRTAQLAMKPANRFYQARILKSLISKVENHSWLWERGFIAEPEWQNIYSVYDYDQSVLVPLHGFNTAEHFYECCNAKPHLSTIDLPWVLINALNDPIASASDFPTIHQLGSKMRLHLVSDGGHLGFLDRASNPLYLTEIAKLFNACCD